MKRTCLILVLVSVFAGTAFGANIFVNQAAVGADNGSSWANAYTTLQPALSAAASGDTVHVASGTYKPAAVGNPGVSFSLANSGVTLLGGYAGKQTGENMTENIADPSAAGSTDGAPGFVRSPISFQTVISGDLNSDDVAVDLSVAPMALNGQRLTTMSDNSNKLLDVQGKANITIDGFIFTGANMIGDKGGAIKMNNQSSLTVKNCVFKQNIAQNGGSCIGIEGTTTVAGPHPNLVVMDSEFVCNSAWGTSAGDGCIKFERSGTFAIIGCKFMKNYCNENGAAIHAYKAAIVGSIDNCYFAYNCAYPNENGGPGIGGSLYFRPEAPYRMGRLSNDVTISNCVFERNYACAGAAMTLTNENDSATDPTPELNYCNYTVTNCLIANNESYYPGYNRCGAIHVDKRGPVDSTHANGTLTANIINCTVVNNNGLNDCCGVSMGNNWAYNNWRNCIMWNNKGTDLRLSKRGTSFYYTINYCDIENVENDPNVYNHGVGVMNPPVDPQFADVACHLKSTSPCIDTGDPADDWSKEPKCNGERIDMGAWGNTAQATPKVAAQAFDMYGDVNCDGNVDLVDFSKLASQWLQ